MNKDDTGRIAVPQPVTDPPTGGVAAPAQHPACVRHENECSRRWDRLREEVKAMQESLIEHKIRLENGSRVFTDIKGEIAGLRNDVKEAVKATGPKPINWPSILFPAFTILVVILGGWWALSERLGERPTINQIEKIMAAHNDSGHGSLRADIQQIREAQIKLGVAYDAIRESVDAIKKSIDAPPSSPSPRPPPRQRN